MTSSQRVCVCVCAHVSECVCGSKTTHTLNLSSDTLLVAWGVKESDIVDLSHIEQHWQKFKKEMQVKEKKKMHKKERKEKEEKETENS